MGASMDAEAAPPYSPSMQHHNMMLDMDANEEQQLIIQETPQHEPPIMMATRAVCVPVFPFSLGPVFSQSSLCHFTGNARCATVVPLSSSPHHHPLIISHHAFVFIPFQFSTIILSSSAKHVLFLVYRILIVLVFQCWLLCY